MCSYLPSYLPYFFETEYFPEPGAHQLSYADSSSSSRDLLPFVTSSGVMDKCDTTANCYVGAWGPN